MAKPLSNRHLNKALFGGSRLIPASPPHVKPALKKFAGNKSLLDIQTQCLAAGIDFVDDLWRKGDDCVSIWTKAKDKSLGYVIYNTFNGNFFGKTPEGGPYGSRGITFRSTSEEHENEPWFQALLSFFYVETSDAELKALTAATSVRLDLGKVL